MTVGTKNIPFRQRGRASLDFLGLLGEASFGLHGQVTADIAEQGITADTLPDDLDDCDAQISAALTDSDAFAFERLLGDWNARKHTTFAIEAFEEIFEELEPGIDASMQGPASLTLDPEFYAPTYWDGVHFHRTNGGWDGHEYMGYIHGEIIHRELVARFFGNDILKQRLKIAEMAPKDQYARILDMGCSSGHFTAALARTYPDAKITGIDLSARMMEQALRTANQHGWDWQLLQRSAEKSGLDDASFDLVASYILLHELPAASVRAVFDEAFRVLAPGGDMIMSDVTRFADLDKLARWEADRGARFGGEPHWRESASLDLTAMATDSGFVDVSATGTFPHVVTGRKPS